MNHYQDALERVSELARVMSLMAAECVAEAGRDDDLVQHLVAIRSLADLTGVIAERYGAGFMHPDDHLLMPIPADNLRRFESREDKQ